MGSCGLAEDGEGGVWLGEGGNVIAFSEAAGSSVVPQYSGIAERTGGSEREGERQNLWLVWHWLPKTLW